MGLDGNYRFAPGDFDIPMGLKGAWLADDRFVVDFDYIGNTGKARATFSFSGDQFKLQISEQGQSLPELTGYFQP